MRVPFSGWTAGLALSSVPSVTAFYPYTPDYTTHGRKPAGDTERGQPPARRQDASAALTLPLRRVPSRRRDNIYQILKSEDTSRENSVAIDQDGLDLSYMVAVTFGDSNEEYHLLLDSAASDTWVMGQACESEACGMHTL